MWNRTIVFFGAMNCWLCREIWYGCLKCHRQQRFYFFPFLFTWLDAMIKMSLPLFIFFDVSVELCTLDLLYPWNTNGGFGWTHLCNDKRFHMQGMRNLIASEVNRSVRSNTLRCDLQKKYILGNRPCWSAENIAAFHSNFGTSEVTSRRVRRSSPESLHVYIIAENKHGLLSKDNTLFISTHNK